jgi:hypothetical protein
MRGRWNKARKGLLRFPLPAGYVRTDEGGWALDPDTQVRERLCYVFDSFRRLGVVRAVVRDLKRQGLELPIRGHRQRGVWLTALESAHAECRDPPLAQSSLCRSLRVWPVRVPE